ncbi:hypothetical protein T492DRAFT_376050 [Pavlovales sp. CCMP2436]|nr:hypothetical protein T492DRAFT_376050 [Pavlovales sp. CCMP2436]
MHASLSRVLMMIALCRVGGSRLGGARVHAHRAVVHGAIMSSAVGAPPAALRRTVVRTLLESEESSVVSTSVLVKGWVRTVRSQKTLSFINVNDGSSLAGLQIVAEVAGMTDYEAVMARIGTGAAIAVTGIVVASKGSGQQFEIQASSIEVIGECDDSYPLQKKRHSLEFLRSIAHLRARTNTIGAIARVRSALAQATHAFFAVEGFTYVQTPLITSSDCEGAGEMFRVSTLPSTLKELPKDAKGEVIDYSSDFFGKPAFLTVSGPTFRAENSQTNRHLAEFHMIEPEIAFADLADVMDNAGVT